MLALQIFRVRASASCKYWLIKIAQKAYLPETNRPSSYAVDRHLKWRWTLESSAWLVRLEALALVLVRCRILCKIGLRRKALPVPAPGHLFEVVRRAPASSRSDQSRPCGALLKRRRWAVSEVFAILSATFSEQAHNASYDDGENCWTVTMMYIMLSMNDFQLVRRDDKTDSCEEGRFVNVTCCKWKPTWA